MRYVALFFYRDEFVNLMSHGIKHFCTSQQNIGLNGTEYFKSVVAYDIKYK